MEQKSKRYEVEGKTYTQQRLVLGQIRQLFELFKGGIPLSTLTRPTPREIMRLLGNDIFRGIAIILRVEGVPLQDKDLDALAKELEWGMTPDVLAEVIRDFFVFTPILSLLAEFNDLMDGLISDMEKQETLLMKSASSSPEEILPSEKVSSGALP